MKKVLSAVLLAALLLTMSFAAFADDGGLNDRELAMLEWVKAEYETTQAGVYVKLPAEMLAGVTNYLSTAGIDITEAQYAAAQTQLAALKTYLKANLTVADGATELKIEDVNKATYDGILAIYEELAKAIDASVIFINTRYLTGKIVLQSNSVQDAALVIVEGQTASGVSTTVVVIASVAVVAALIAVAFVLTKKKEQVHA